MRDSSLRRRTALTTAATRSTVGAGSRNSSVNTCRTCDAVTAGVFPPETQPLGLQEPQRQKRQGHVMLPAHPAPDLVVCQPHLLLALLQPLLEPLSCPVCPRQLPTPGLTGVRQGVPRPGHRLAAPEYHQPFARPDPTALLPGLHRGQQHLDAHRPLLAVPHPHRAPAPARLTR